MSQSEHRRIVQKFGGSSVADAESIKRVARRVLEAKQAGNQVVVVISAMGDTTDELMDLALQVSPQPQPRELDMLLTTGERQSAALLAMAMNDLGVEALSYTGSQAGVITTAQHGNARIIDLTPGRSLARVEAEVAHPRGARSLASHLQSRVGIAGLKMALLRECLDAATLADPARLAAAIKALPVALIAPRPIDEAISTAGGLRFEELDAHLMVQSRPGLFCAGEMLDWEAPTGGYLLTACFASGHRAAEGVLAWLAGAQGQGNTY